MKTNQNEQQVTKKYFEKRISLKEYLNELSKIAEKRNVENIKNKKDKRSMSSTKWN